MPDHDQPPELNNDTKPTCPSSVSNALPMVAKEVLNYSESFEEKVDKRLKQIVEAFNGKKENNVQKPGLSKNIENINITLKSLITEADFQNKLVPISTSIKKILNSVNLNVAKSIDQDPQIKNKDVPISEIVDNIDKAIGTPENKSGLYNKFNNTLKIVNKLHLVNCIFHACSILLVLVLIFIITTMWPATTKNTSESLNLNKQAIAKEQEVKSIALSDADVQKIRNAFMDTVNSPDNKMSKDYTPIFDTNLFELRELKTKVHNLGADFKVEIENIEKKRKSFESFKLDINKLEEMNAILQAKLKELQKEKSIDKSLLVVFTASTDLHLTDEIAIALADLFKDQSKTKTLGFQRALFTLIQETFTPVVPFDKDQPGIIPREIANRDAVNLNLVSVLKRIKEESSKSTKTQKEILILAGAEGSPPNLEDPNIHVFKDGKHTVSLVFVVRPGSLPQKITYERWIKWASDNNATATWIYDEPANKIDRKIVSIIKKAMGKDMGF